MAASKPTSRLLRNFHILSHLITILGPYLVVWAFSLSTMDLSTHSLSDGELYLAFGVCIGLVSRDDPLAETVLYPPTVIHEALPK